MAFANDSVIMTSIAAHQGSVDFAGTKTALFNSASAAIIDAVAGGAFTCTTSISGQSSGDVQYLLEALHSMQYTTSISSTTLTINW